MSEMFWEIHGWSSHLGERQPFQTLVWICYGEKFDEGMSVFLWSVLAKLRPSPLHIRTLDHDPWTQPIQWGLLIQPRPGRFLRQLPCQPNHLCRKKVPSKHEHCPYYLYLFSFYPSCVVVISCITKHRESKPHTSQSYIIKSIFNYMSFTIALWLSDQFSDYKLILWESLQNSS
jgi:hypothetical protein